MTRQLQRIAGLLFALFAALFVNLNYLQVLRAGELSNDPRNSRQLIREYEIERGAIVVGQVADAAPIAFSEETAGPLRYLRRYPDGPLYAHVTGFYSVVFGRTEVEQQFNEFLVGSAPEAFTRNLGDLLAGRQRQGDDVITTLRPQVQQTAREALGSRRGAVVALDPRSGEVLALWSYPSYDPNLLSSHDRAAVTAYWEQTEADPTLPRLNRALRQIYPPGSTFKLVTAAAALEAGVGPARTFPDPRELDLPLTTATIRNFGGGLCNGGQPLTLVRAVAVSCNTTFAQLGLDLGAERLVAQAEAFGLNHDWDFQLPLEPSRIPKELDEPSTAQSAIGQRDVRVTPLQMAMIGGAIGNNGVLMTPRIVRQVTDTAGRTIVNYGPEPLFLPGQPNAQALSPQNAGILRDMMVGVVDGGSGTNAAIPGVRVAGKTGTAQTGPDRPPTVWFVGFAPAEAPQVAVAVVIEDGGDVGSEATGGRLAAPVAKAVMEAALRPAP